MTSRPGERRSPLGRAAATIANGASLSGAVELEGMELVAIEMPAAWTAANLTFQGSHDGVTFNNVHDDAGTEVSVTAAAARFIRLNPELWGGFHAIKVRSGTAGAAVNQGAERVINLVLRQRPV